MKTLEFFAKRHSVRKFKDEEVPQEDIEKIIKAATLAPSGKNIQNWHFVVVKSRDMIEKMAKAVEDRNIKLSEYAESDADRKFSKMIKYHTVFRNAPVVILVFSGPYPATGLNLIKASGADMDEIHAFLKPAPGIQNIGAAMQNLQLAAAHMGYGGCWMTGCNYAAKQIEDIVGFKKEGYSLACMTPLGVPESLDLKSPPRNPVEDVMTVIE
ncbi:nitroreductase family protein [Fusibacter sp. JL216-2]|uniref:nitroreductase family protein n=1 Tax=Fusibacter sp. JL216-2 TaxID=3071453 RepID=UPI003D351D77